MRAVLFTVKLSKFPVSLADPSDDIIDADGHEHTSRWYGFPGWQGGSLAGRVCRMQTSIRLEPVQVSGVVLYSIGSQHVSQVFIADVMSRLEGNCRPVVECL